MIPKPLKDRVLIKTIPLDDVTEGGLIVPEEHKESHPSLIGEVIAIGPGTIDIPMDVKVGDRVMHLKQAGMDISWEEEDYKIIRSLDIVVIL